MPIKYPAEFLQSLQKLDKDAKIRFVEAMLNAYDSRGYIIKFFEDQTDLTIPIEELPKLIYFMLRDEQQNLFSQKEALQFLVTVCRHIPDDQAQIKQEIQSLYPILYKTNIRNKKNFAYRPSPAALTKQLQHTSITRNELVTILMHDLNISDYIVLMANFIHDQVNKKNTNAKEIMPILDNIKRLYLNLEYEKCAEELKKIISILEKNPSYSAEFKALKLPVAFKKIEPKKNVTRRAFETYLSQYILGSTEEPKTLESIAKIAKYFGYTATSASHLDILISLMSDENYSQEIYRMHEKLQEDSKLFDQADSIMRPGFLEHHEKTEKSKGESSYTKNVGLFTASLPTFFEHQSKHPIENRTIDILDSDRSSPGYSTSNKRDRAVFVSSVSGHAFFVIAMLSEYMKNNPGPSLNKDINNFVLAYIGTYAKLGYHSMYEVIDVFNEPHIAKIFKEQGVEINTQVNKKILNFAFNDALAYTKGILLRENINKDIPRHPSRTKRTI